MCSFKICECTYLLLLNVSYLIFKSDFVIILLSENFFKNPFLQDYKWNFHHIHTVLQTVTSWQKLELKNSSKTPCSSGIH